MKLRKYLKIGIPLCCSVVGVLLHTNEVKANAVNDYIIQGYNQKGWRAPKEKADLGSIPRTSKYINGKPQGVVIHETANDKSTIAGEISYMKRNYQNAFVHEFVDGANIIGIADTDYVSWGAGPAANARFIQTEQVRVHSKDEFARELMNLAEIKSQFLKQYGLKPSLGNTSTGGGTVWTHHMVSIAWRQTDHTDPDGYWADRAKRFFGTTYTINDFMELLNKTYNNQLLQPSPAKVSTKVNVVQQGDNFKVTVKISGDVGRVTKVRVPTWCETGGQDDLKWYDTKKVSNDTYEVVVPVTNHKQQGLYTFHTYVYTNDGKQQVTPVQKTYVNPGFKGTNTSSMKNADVLNVIGTLSGDFNRLSNVQIAVWAIGTKDVKYYPVNQTNGKLSGTVDLSKHGKYGDYYGDIYAFGKDGMKYFIGTCKVTRSVGKVGTTETITRNGRKVTVTAKFTGDIGKLKTVEAATWADKGNRSDLKYYKLDKKSADTWQVTYDVGNHKVIDSKYYSDIRVDLGAGIQFASSGSIMIDSKNLKMTSVTSKLTGSNLRVDTKFSEAEAYLIDEVQYPTWGAPNGQNDLVWYKGNFSGSASNINIDLAKHKEVGDFYTHIYVKLLDGSRRYVGKTADTKYVGMTKVSEDKTVRYNVLKASTSQIFEDVVTKKLAKLSNATAVKNSNSAKSLNVKITNTVTYSDKSVWAMISQNNVNIGWVNKNDLEKGY